LKIRKLGIDQRGGLFVLEIMDDVKYLDKLKTLHMQLTKEKGYFPNVSTLVDNNAWDNHSVLFLGAKDQESFLESRLLWLSNYFSGYMSVYYLVIVRGWRV
jgi:hypothetical protein